MLEESGIDIRNEKVKIHYLGKHYANKTSTKLWFFYGIDLTKLNLDLTKTYKGTGDNTIGEKEISARFVSLKQLNKSNDALSLVTHSKLTLKNLISFDNNINQKLDMILQILNEQKSNNNNSDQTEKELKAESYREKGYPDLLIHYENKIMIIEFERTRKTKQRMRQKFDGLRHYCKNGYEILFLVPNESMKKFVDEQIKIYNWKLATFKTQIFNY